MTDNRALRADFEANMVAVVRREIPEALDWLMLGEAPSLHWLDDGTAVDRVVDAAVDRVVDRVAQRGWLATAFDRGKARANAAIHQVARLFEPASAADFGRWLLNAWIEHDTAQATISDARRAELRATAEQAAQLARRFGRSGADPEERFGQLMQQEENRAAPSALPYRGLLAIVEACADDTISDEVEAYLARHGQERPEQSNLLIETLQAISQRPARQ